MLLHTACQLAASDLGKQASSGKMRRLLLLLAQSPGMPLVQWPVRFGHELLLLMIAMSCRTMSSQALPQLPARQEVLLLGLMLPQLTGADRSRGTSAVAMGSEKGVAMHLFSMPPS